VPVGLKNPDHKHQLLTLRGSYGEGIPKNACMMPPGCPNTLGGFLFASSQTQTCRRTNTGITPVDLVIPIPEKMLQVQIEETYPMNRLALSKTLFQVIIICILVVEIVRQRRLPEGYKKYS
jgi:hypothetical protein